MTHHSNWRRYVVQPLDMRISVHFRTRGTVLIAVLSVLFGQIACSRKQKSDANTDVSAGGTTKTTEGARTEARTYLEKGKEFYLKDEDTQAAEAFEEAIKLDPELAEAHFRLGLTNDALGLEKEAEDAYRKAVASYKKYFAIDKNNKDAEAHYNLGQTYAGLRLYTEAVKEYRQATRVKPDDAAIHYDLGRALMKLAQYDEAAEAFERSLELDPENYRAEDELAEAREGIKRIKVGKKHQEELLRKAELLKKQQDNANVQEEDGPNQQKPVSKKPNRTDQQEQ